jgi:hypothetical protein
MAKLTKLKDGQNRLEVKKSLRSKINLVKILQVVQTLALLYLVYQSAMHK